MIKLDLHDFFSNIREPAVYRTFADLGYSRLLSFELARLTTRIEDDYFGYSSRDYSVIESYRRPRIGSLPQGAPTSGKLANLHARHLDERLQKFADSHDLIYSRYSDDMVFSSSGDFRRAKASSLFAAIRSLVCSAGFVPHHRKSRIIPPGARKVVLGLLVEEEVRLLPEHRRKIEVHLRASERFGLAGHAAHRGFSSVFSFVNHLDGWISFAMSVERARAIEWRHRLDATMRASGLA